MQNSAVVCTGSEQYHLHTKSYHQTEQWRRALLKKRCLKAKFTTMSSVSLCSFNTNKVYSSVPAGADYRDSTSRLLYRQILIKRINQLLLVQLSCFKLSHHLSLCLQSHSVLVHLFVVHCVHYIHTRAVRKFRQGSVQNVFSNQTWQLRTYRK